MKVIDLLNKIANGEDVPEKIKYNNIIYNWDIKGYLHYEDETYSERAFLEGYRTDMCLNDEVEIIEDTPNEDINVNLAYIDKEYLLDNKDVDRKINEIINRHNILVNKVIDLVERLNGEK